MIDPQGRGRRCQGGLWAAGGMWTAKGLSLVESSGPEPVVGTAAGKCVAGAQKAGKTHNRSYSVVETEAISQAGSVLSLERLRKLQGESWGNYGDRPSKITKRSKLG